MSSTSNKLQKNLMGAEPIHKVIDNEGQLARVLSWYSCMCDKSDARRWLEHYTSTYRSDKLTELKSMPDNKLNNTIGWLARILSNGSIVSSHVSDKLNNYIDQLCFTALVNTSGDFKTYYDKIQHYAPVFEAAIDAVDPTFNAYQYLISNSVSQTHANRLIEMYAPLIRELDEVEARVDPQLIEGYRNFSRSKFKEFHQHVKTIFSDCQRFIGNTKKERKPRKTKTKLTSSIIKNFKCMPNYPPLKLSSCKPETVVGSSLLFTYNTNNNVLTMYQSANASGLTINRSSISNYDETKLFSKKLGKLTEKIISTILIGSKTAAVKTFTSINSAQNQGSDRVSDKIILLRVYK